MYAPVLLLHARVCFRWLLLIFDDVKSEHHRTRASEVKTVAHDPEVVAELARYFLDKAYDEGRPPFNDEAWLAKTEKMLMAQNTPDQIRRKVDGVRARASGKKITGWRETRGTHGIDYLPDPKGTDIPEWWR
jgi:hypothetical protein